MAERIFSWWAKNYFLDPLATLSALIGSIIFIAKRKRNSIAYRFLYYFLGYFLLKITVFSNDLLFQGPVNVRQQFVLLVDYLFTMFESFVFFNFFKKTLFFDAHKTGLLIIFYLFLFVGGGLLAYDLIAFEKIRRSSRVFLFNFQAFGLMIPCTFYYLEIFKSKPTSTLLDLPSFWIVTGLSFFMISTLPCSILLDSLWKDRQTVYYYVFNLFHIFYIILFSMIIRAYICNPATEK